MARKPPVTPVGRLSLFHCLVVWLVAAALFVLIGWQVVVPVRTLAARRLVERGDAYLLGQDFTSAADEYRRALTYDPKNLDALSRLRMAQEAPTDIAVTRSFYEQHGVRSVVSKIDLALENYPTAKQAVQSGVAFYQNQDYAYAQYPLRRAVQLDPGYPEAWNYLGLTYAELAKQDPSYQKKADQAFARRDALTPRYLKP